MSWTYTKNSVPDVNTEKLLELWNSLSSTNLFRLEIAFTDRKLVHIYYLKNTDLSLEASTTKNGQYKINLIQGKMKDLTPEEFWSKVPKENKKILAFHLDKIL